MRMSAERKNNVIKIYNSRRYSIETIASITNLTIRTIRYIIREGRENGAIPFEARMYRKLTEAQKEEIAKDYYVNGLTEKQICEKYKMSGGTSFQWVRKYGEKFGQKKRGVKSGFSEKEKSEILTERQKGASFRELYVKYGATKKQIEEWSNENAV